MHATPDQAEAARLMVVCNSCRYCEGLCAVFPAMEARTLFADGDVDYLANLCHACGACYYDCQFSPPHEFSVNVPRTLAAVRAGSYARYVWPRALAPVWQRNGLAMVVGTALAIAAFIVGFVAGNDPAAVFARHTGPGAFYALMPHNAMALLFGAALLYAILALAMATRQFWRATGGGRAERRDYLQAARDAAALRFLDGGGAGCMNGSEYPTDRRRVWHHLAAYGFLLCLASTSSATILHYLGYEAPYAWWAPPVVLGTLGGTGLVAGCAGLWAAKRRRDPAMREETQRPMETAFTAMLLATGITGLALLLLRATPAMGVLLAVHLGVVLALFLALPYGKFVHGVFRFAALVRSAGERRAIV